MNKVEFLEVLIDEIEDFDSVAQVKELIQGKLDEALQLEETKEIYELNLGSNDTYYDPEFELDLDEEDDTY